MRKVLPHAGLRGGSYSINENDESNGCAIGILVVVASDIECVLLRRCLSMWEADIAASIWESSYGHKQVIGNFAEYSQAATILYLLDSSIE